jgi:hypothetical protein
VFLPLAAELVDFDCGLVVVPGQLGAIDTQRPFVGDSGNVR